MVDHNEPEKPWTVAATLLGFTTLMLYTFYLIGLLNFLSPLSWVIYGVIGSLGFGTLFHLEFRLMGEAKGSYRRTLATATVAIFYLNALPFVLFSDILPYYVLAFVLMIVFLLVFGRRDDH